MIYIYIYTYREREKIYMYMCVSLSLSLYIYIYIGERFMWVLSEQQLAGTFQKKAKERKAGYLGGAKVSGSLGFNPT